MELLICDLDRTLVFRCGFETLYFKQVEQLGLQPQKAQACWESSHGVPLFKQLTSMGISAQDAAHFCAQLFEDCLLLPTQALPGAKELLTAAGARGIPVCVSSGSGQALLEQALHSSGLNPLVDLVLGSEPDFLKGPEHMNKIKARFHLPNRAPFMHSCMIGDGVNDMQIARSHGVGEIVGVLFNSLPGADSSQLQAAGADWVAADLLEARQKLFA